MKLNRLHFQPIRGKALDIVAAILQTEEVASAGKAFGVIRLVAEELVMNIVDYAYPDGGDDYLDVEIECDEKHITLRFRDGGVPFNPLEQAPPDISLPMEQRRIGGLGFFIVSKKMDSVEYEYTDGENVLTVMKELK
jgi:anti-sigma regulatory factor (Ser/Thr protein kinase)